MSLQKQNSHKLTVKAARGGINSRPARNRIRGTIIIIGTISRQFDVSTPMTPVLYHLLCLDFVGCAKKVRGLLNELLNELVNELCNLIVLLGD